MGSRGPSSIAQLSIVGPSRIETIRRPLPPAELNDEQAVEWNAIVSRMPADWFGRETHALLAQYCRHIVAARRVAELVKAVQADEQFDISAYDRALKMQEREGRAISSLATKMRISQQSTYDRKKVISGRGGGKKPWD